MSKLNELKQMSPTLRAAMARRDSIRKHVNKHKGNAQHCQAQIISLNKKLEELTDVTIERTAKFSADCELELDYVAKAGVLLKKAQKIVDDQIAELDAIRAQKDKDKPTGVAKAVAVDAKQGKAIRDAQQAGFDTPEQHEAAKLEEIKVAAEEAREREADELRKRIDDAQSQLDELGPVASDVEEEPPKGDEHMPEEDVDAELAKELAKEGKPDEEAAPWGPKKQEPKIWLLEPEPKKEELPKSKPVVPEVEPVKDEADNEPPVRGMSKRQRRKANRLARLAAQQGG